VQELTKIDFEILAVINKFEPISIKGIKNKIATADSLEYRLEVMEKQEYKHSLRAYLPNSSLVSQKYKITTDNDGYDTLEPLGIYEITDLGRKVLQDYITQERTNRKNLWLKNAWIPMLVAFVTTLITIALKPLLQALLERFLQMQK